MPRSISVERMNFTTYLEAPEFQLCSIDTLK